MSNSQYHDACLPPIPFSIAVHYTLHLFSKIDVVTDVSASRRRHRSRHRNLDLDTTSSMHVVKDVTTGQFFI
jgi:hypothetical protein